MKHTPLVLVMMLAFGLPAFGADHPELKAFPVSLKDLERFVIVLPHKERGEERNFKVELIVGKTMLTDGVNRMQLGNTIQPRPLKGWGYTYYEVTGPSVAMSTLIGVPPGTQKVKQFVSATPLLIRYNSRLPVVVYAPKGYEVRYRVWKAPKVTEKAEKG